ncbi:MAG: AAA family ATPase [Oscillospiraceae bacterium]|nr:AAA family ATPase [Oscillospiraceae bacterium]
MTINKLTASFGKLNGESLELTEGLNVICAPNESGKSTWCAFIRAMLYGIDSAERQKAGHLPDKLRYAPWSGAAMQGEMELSAGGKDITITRTTKLKSAPMRELSAVYTGTNIPVEGLDAANAGEMLTGASREVFKRSAFVEQGSIVISSSPELEKRISAIVSTGDEDCSFTEADEQLRAWQRSRRYNRRGKLPELEERMAETKKRLAELDSLANESERLTQQLEQGRQNCRQLENEITESRKTARRDALSNLQNLRKELNAANEAHEKADDERDARRAALCGCVIGERQPDEVAAEVKADTAKCLELKEISEKKTSPVLSTVLLLIALAVIAAAIFIIPQAYTPYAFLAGGVLCLISAALYVRHIKAKNAAHDAGRQRKLLLSKYKAEDESGIKSCYEEFLKLFDELSAAENEEKRTAQRLAEMRTTQEKTEAKTLQELDFSGGDNEASQLSRELSAAQRSCDMLSARISEIKGRVDAMGDPLVLGSELNNMESLYAALQSEYDAIALAVDTLRAADADIQGRFSPELGKLAAHYMSVVTDGRYEGVLINRDFSAKTKLSGDTVPRETEYLSAGTLDLMYLAVRLAVCTLALPENSACPLILDDALVNFDAERTQQAMKLLREISKQRQVILFTCKEV